MNRRTFIAFLGAQAVTLPLAATAAPAQPRLTREDIHRACEFGMEAFRRFIAQTQAEMKQAIEAARPARRTTVIRLVGDPLTRRDLEQIFRQIDKETRHQ